MALLHVNMKSDALRLAVEVDVVLPQASPTQIGMKGASKAGPYPTLYLLHGMSDDHTIWQRRTSIERYAADKNLAVVMPSTHLGWYTDMQKGNRYYEYISCELPAACERMFPLSPKREDRFVAGLSMGGYGAMKIGLRAHAKFCAAASLSGAMDVCRIMGDKHDAYWDTIFPQLDRLKGSDDDLFALAEKLAKSGAEKTKLYMWCGLEDFLYQDNIRMRAHLNKLGYDLRYEESAGGHTWDRWDDKIQTVLSWLPIAANAGKGAK